MKKLTALALAATFLLLPDAAKAHHRAWDGEQRPLLALGAPPFCDHERAGPHDRRIDLRAELGATGYDIPNPWKIVVIWRLYGRDIYSDEDLRVLRRIRDVSIYHPGDRYFTIGSTYDVDQDFEANRWRLLLHSKVRWFFDGRIVRHRNDIVEWIPRNDPDEAQGCQP